MANVDWGQEVRPSVHDLIQAVNELESYTDVEREVTGTFLTRNVLDGASGDAEISEVRGNTVVWNQLANDATSGVYNCTKQIDADGVIELTCTLDSTNYYALWIGDALPAYVQTGHKVLLICEMKGDFTTNTPIGITNSRVESSIPYTNQNDWQKVYVLCTITAGASHLAQFYARPSQGVSWTVGSKSYVRKRQIFDLTLQYGAGNEPTATEFEAQYGSDYKPYSAPRLLDANIAGINDLAFPMQTLRGINAIQDAMTKNGIVRHIGTADLGALTWTADPNSNGMYFGNGLQNMKVGTWSWAEPKNCLAIGYRSVSTQGVYDPNSDLKIALWDMAGRVGLRNNTVASAEALKAELSGVILQYELATPTTEQFETPIDLTYSVESGGTETWVVSTGDAPTSAPPTATIRYKMQYEYELITEKSFDNFCDALGTALNLDIAKSWNADTREWDFTITQAASSLHAIGNSEDVAVISEPIELQPIEKENETIEPVKEVNENE